MKFPDRLRKPGYKYLLAIVVLGIVFTAPRWGRALGRRLTYFHVRAIEIHGAKYLQPADVVARLRIDTLRSLFDAVGPLEARLRGHPQIAAVQITRHPPGTLVVTITENPPVALVPFGDGMRPYDSAGRALPIDPSRTTLDLPVLTSADPATLHLLGAIQRQQATFFNRISMVERDGPNDVIFVLTPSLRVRTSLGVAPNRLQDIFPVESDLARRHERPAELDLRYRDQVIARL
ncbi:MAG TPA: FtsQ-type POTRA domain-containing protein [Gemmatimonadaceae bacterium]|nr:FtsQ-type POTRA domain-containing protein [Gemmatimonadaceae bacterium]